MKKQTYSKLKSLVNKLIEQKYNKMKLITEDFSSPLMNQLWKLIKKTDSAAQKNIIKALNDTKNLGRVAWDKLPEDAVEKLTPSTAASRKNAINFWISEKHSDFGPVLAVTRGKTVLYDYSSLDKRGSSVNPRPLGGATVAGEAIDQWLDFAADYVISIDIDRAMSTNMDVLNLIRDRANQKAGMLDKMYKPHINAIYKSLSSGKSPSFVKDAYRQIAAANNARYKKIIADRIAHAGTGDFDALIKEAIKLSEQITQAVIDYNMRNDDENNHAPRFGMMDVGNEMSQAFRNYQLCNEYNDELTASIGRNNMSTDFLRKIIKDNLYNSINDLRKNVNNLKQLYKQASNI